MKKIERGAGIALPQDRLAANIAAQAPGMTNADAKNLLQIMIRSIAAEIRATGDVTVGGLGRFRVKRRPSRKTFIPSTKAMMQIPARTVLVIKPSKHFVNRCIDEATEGS